jgi:hypothetical protein
MGEALGQDAVEGVAARRLPFTGVPRLAALIEGSLKDAGEALVLLGQEVFGGGADGVGAQAAAGLVRLQLQPGGKVADHGGGDRFAIGGAGRGGFGGHHRSLAQDGAG